jgi:hypothetical protein
MHAGMTNIKDIVFMYMDEALQTTAAYRRLYGIAQRGAVDLMLDVTANVKSCELCVMGNKTAELPDDYIKWSKIGVLNPYGEIATLKRNEQLTLINDGRTSRLSDNESVVGTDLFRINEGYYLNFSGYGYGYGCADIFGISGNDLSQLGEFKVDETCGLIVLNATFPYPNVILEYIASPSEEDGFMIPLEAQEALIAWISWKDINQLAASRKVSIYDKQARRREYYTQKNNARWRIKPFRTEEAYDVTQSAMRLVPKS